MVVSRDDGEHEGGDQEPLDLDPFPAQDLDEGDCEEIAGHVAGSGDDEIAVGVLEQGVVLVFALGEADGGEQDGLVEIGAVEGDVDEEPSERGPEEDL